MRNGGDGGLVSFLNMERISEIGLSDKDDPGHATWLSIVESLGISHNGVNILPCLSLVAPQSASDIKRYIRDLDCSAESITKKDLISFIDATRSLFYIQDLGFCDRRSFSFLMVLASYISETGGSYGDIAETFGASNVPEVYMHADKRRTSIGMVCKLYGLTKTRNMRRMDCPRVWDLETDEIVNNPNIGDDPDHQIAAITHRWQTKEFVYEDLVEIRRTNNILKELDRPLKPIKISPMSPKLTKIKEELGGQVRYVWMDTLCIDKTSSVELDMSIRSMHRWYSNAAFVYLEYHTSFKEWCTRGWTLQEGHAAKSLHISPKHGKFFVELLDTINGDGCAKLALNEWYGYRNSLYWIGLMELRRTSVPEDKAYALIGLLGIDFQIAYGEGGRAMDRICEEIAKQKGDVSWLATARYRDATNVHKRSVPVKEILGAGYLNSHPRHEVQLTSTGIKLEVTNITVYLSHVRDAYKKYHGHDIYVDEGDCYWIASSKVMIVTKLDGKSHNIRGVRCMDNPVDSHNGMPTITINYKYFENTNNSVLGRREP